MNRKRLTLVILLGLLAIAMAYAYWAMPRQELAPPRAAIQRPQRPAASPPRGERAAVNGAPRDVVALALLQSEPDPFPGASRDIFRFRERRPVAPPPPPPVAAPPPQIVAPPPVQPNPLEVLQRSLAKFTFLGYLERGQIRTIFLSSAGEIYVVSEGEAFGKNKEFVVESISKKELMARSIAQATTIRVPLIENEQLSPAISAPADVPAARSGAPSPILRSQPNIPQRRNVRFRPPEPTAPAEEDWEQPDQDELEPQEEPFEQEPPDAGDEKEGGADGSNQ